MNERIQNLINQSWQTVEGTPRKGMEDIRQALMEDLNPVFLEFARLMVKECIHRMHDEIIYNDSYKERNKAIRDMMEIVKQHSGV